MLKKIEKGMQLGIEKRIQKEQKYFWYSYAVQKKGNVYYVYEYENIYKYLSFDEVKNFFHLNTEFILKTFM